MKLLYACLVILCIGATPQVGEVWWFDNGNTYTNGIYGHIYYEVTILGVTNGYAKFRDNKGKTNSLGLSVFTGFHRKTPPLPPMPTRAHYGDIQL